MANVVVFVSSVLISLTFMILSFVERTEKEGPYRYQSNAWVFLESS